MVGFIDAASVTPGELMEAREAPTHTQTPGGGEWRRTLKRQLPSSPGGGPFLAPNVEGFPEMVLLFRDNGRLLFYPLTPLARDGRTERGMRALWPAMETVGRGEAVLRGLPSNGPAAALSPSCSICICFPPSCQHGLRASSDSSRQPGCPTSGRRRPRLR
jgi:hypothetical protein